MDRPVIGMCTALERARWSVWDQPAVLLARSYVDAVHGAGGLAVLLPPDPQLVQQPDEALELIDGLLLAGGADLDPASYGEPAHAETQDAVPERDAFEIALTRAAIERDVPVLGICRGMQLINVALGGTLIQHLPEHLGHRGAPARERLLRWIRPRRRRAAGHACDACHRRLAPRHQVTSPSGR